MTGFKVPAIFFALAIFSLSLGNAWARGGSSASDRGTRANTREISNPDHPTGVTAPERSGSSMETSPGTAATGATPSADRTTTTSLSKAAMAANDRAVVIHFDKGQSALKQNDIDKLRNVISSIGIENIERIEVAAWSDSAFPRAGSDLPKADRDLAEQRASRIHDFLKSQLNVSGMKIKSFNMAETSNWLARTMRTEDAELKSIFAKEGAVPVHREDFNFIAKEGAPSEAVVVVVRK